MLRRPPRSTLFPTRRSSDLAADPGEGIAERAAHGLRQRDRDRVGSGELDLLDARFGKLEAVVAGIGHQRSEERRVGKECRSRWGPGESKEVGIEEDREDSSG